MALDCCWFNPDRKLKECPNIKEGEEELYSSPRKRLVEKCIECHCFLDDLQSFEKDNPLYLPFSILREEYLEQKGYLQSIAGFLSSKSHEIKFLHELSIVLQTSIDMDEVLSVAMTAITSGKGFGMNRAFLLMVDREHKYLKGYMGIGPKNYEEAWHIWDEVEKSDFSLLALAEHFRNRDIVKEKEKFRDILDQLTVSCNDKDHIFNRALQQKTPILVKNAFDNSEVNPELARILGVESFLIMPLISRNRRIGILLVDNFVTNRQITPRDMQSIEIFAFPVAFAIERASLYEKLQEEVDKQTTANLKLQKQQELIVKMEKMAVIGHVMASIAHSIRNPLTAIGGYARALLKKPDNINSKTEYLEYIVNEAKQLEKVLEEVLSYSDSLYPVMDWWDINHLVKSACNEKELPLEGKKIKCLLNLEQDIPLAFIDYKQIVFCLKMIIDYIVTSQPLLDTILVNTGHGEDHVFISMAAEGIPISNDLLTALTTPFATIEDMRFSASLPLCKIILEKQRCSFSISELPEGGNMYCIKLPRRKEE
ncbi:MAG: GAF domain-containing protein [Desulfuromonadales bacterium]|nr:GAF domain-containing protein [Desulfuromonadales bacterium]